MAVGQTITDRGPPWRSPASAAPSVINSASVASPTFDPDSTDNSDDDPTLVPLADLSLTKRLLGRRSPDQWCLTRSRRPTSARARLRRPGHHRAYRRAGSRSSMPIGVGSTCSAAAQTVTCRTDWIRVGRQVCVSRDHSRSSRLRGRSRRTIAYTARVGTAQNPGDSPSAADLVTTNNDATATATVTVPSMPGTGSSGLGVLRHGRPVADRPGHSRPRPVSPPTIAPSRVARLARQSLQPKVQLGLGRRLGLRRSPLLRGFGAGFAGSPSTVDPGSATTAGT